MILWNRPPITKVYTRRNTQFNAASEDHLEEIHTTNEFAPEIDYRLIAVRKVTRECTKHSLYNFLSYVRLNSHLKAFTSALDSDIILRDTREAMSILEYIDAVYEEMRALIKNKTCEFSTIKDIKLIGFRWIFTSNCNTGMLGCKLCIISVEPGINL